MNTPDTYSDLSQRGKPLHLTKLFRVWFVVLFCVATQHVLAADAKATRFFEDAQARYDKKDYEGSIIQLKNALQIDKNMPLARVLMGKALLRSGDPAGAEISFTDAMSGGIPRADVVVFLAQAYLGQGKQKQIFEQPLFDTTGLPGLVKQQLLLVRAAAAADVGELQRALKIIDEARAIDPNFADLWVAEVPVRIRLRQFKEAAAAVDRATALAPNSADTHYQKGSVAHAALDVPGALAAYGKAIAADADHVAARMARAGIQIDLGKYKEASQDLAEIQRVQPVEPRAAYLRALIAEKDGKTDEAREALKEITELLDQFPIDYVRYRPQFLMLNGLAHFGLNEPEKARRYFELFQKNQPDAPITKPLAQIYLKSASYDLAIEVLEPYLRARPEDGQALALLASALMGKGQFARATALMEKSLQTRDAPEFHAVLGMTLLRSGKPEGAIKELEAALKSDPKQSQAAYTLITLYMRAGQAAKAAALADKLSKQSPNHAGFAHLLGVVKYTIGDFASARPAFEKASKLDAKFTPPSLYLARLDIAAKHLDAARTRLDMILKAEPKNAEAMYEQATVASRKGDMVQAQQWLEKTAALSGPRETRWGVALSDFYLRRGNIPGALEAAKQMSAKATDELTVNLALAKAQIANGDATGAKSSLSTATKLAAYNPTQQFQVGLLQMAINNLPGAAYSLEKALSTQPDYLPAQALMAEVELRQGNPEAAEKRAKTIVAKNPKRGVGYRLLGDIALSKKQTGPALDAYKKAYQTEPLLDTLMRQFQLLAGQDKGQGAVAVAQQWLKTHPDSTPVLGALADLHARNGDFAAARASYEAIVRLNPKDSVALNNLANVLLIQKDPKGISVAEQAVAAGPSNAYAMDTLGWALFQAGQTERALKLLRDARKQEPKNADIRYHLAAVLAKSGMKDEARIELDTAFKTPGTFSERDNALALQKSLT